jgi:hypothetical protein
VTVKGNVSFIMYDRTYENLIPIHLKCHEKSTDLISCCWLWTKILEILNGAVGTTETVIQFNSLFNNNNNSFTTNNNACVIAVFFAIKQEFYNIL